MAEGEGSQPAEGAAAGDSSLSEFITAHKLQKLEGKLTATGLTVAELTAKSNEELIVLSKSMSLDTLSRKRLLKAVATVRKQESGEAVAVPKPTPTPVASSAAAAVVIPAPASVKKSGPVAVPGSYGGPFGGLGPVEAYVKHSVVTAQEHEAITRVYEKYVRSALLGQNLEGCSAVLTKTADACKADINAQFDAIAEQMRAKREELVSGVARMGEDKLLRIKEQSVALQQYKRELYEAQQSYAQMIKDPMLDAQSRQQRVLDMVSKVLAKSKPATASDEDDFGSAAAKTSKVRLTLVTQPKVRLAYDRQHLGAFLDTVYIDDCDQPPTPLVTITSVAFSTVTIEMSVEDEVLQNKAIEFVIEVALIKSHSKNAKKALAQKARDKKKKAKKASRKKKAKKKTKRGKKKKKRDDSSEESSSDDEKKDDSESVSGSESDSDDSESESDSDDDSDSDSSENSESDSESESKSDSDSDDSDDSDESGDSRRKRRRKKKAKKGKKKKKKKRADGSDESDSEEVAVAAADTGDIELEDAREGTSMISTQGMATTALESESEEDVEEMRGAPLEKVSAKSSSKKKKKSKKKKRSKYGSDSEDEDEDVKKSAAVASVMAVAVDASEYIWEEWGSFEIPRKYREVERYRSARKFEFTVKRLIDETEYAIRVKARNKSGWGEACAALKVTTKKLTLDSNILKDKEKALLLKWLSKAKDKGHKRKLLFRGSRDGFTGQAFHSKCDGKSPTVCIIRTTTGNVFGGYTKLAWSSAAGYKQDPKAWIFLLRSKSKKKKSGKWNVTNATQAVYHNQSYGPAFGGGYDFYLANACNTNSSSYSNPGTSYSCPKDQSLLAGAYNFMVKDYEVFHVK